MNQYFKTKLLKLARRIIFKLDPETAKNLRYIEAYEIKIFDSNVTLSEKEVIESIETQVIAEKIRYKIIQKTVNAMFCRGYVDIDCSIDAQLKMHRYDARVRLLIPKL